MSIVKYVQLYADREGESHLQHRQIELTSTNYAPPAPVLDVSLIEPATGCGFARLETGWIGGWHPSPKRQWIFFLAGVMEFEVSSGDVHRAAAGSVILLEDTTGKGHQSRVVSDEAAVVVIVHL